MNLSTGRTPVPELYFRIENSLNQYHPAYEGVPRMLYPVSQDELMKDKKPVLAAVMKACIEANISSSSNPSTTSLPKSFLQIHHDLLSFPCITSCTLLLNNPIMLCTHGCVSCYRGILVNVNLVENTPVRSGQILTEKLCCVSENCRELAQMTAI